MRTVAATLAVAILLVVSAGITLAGDRSTTGDRISLFGGDREVEAGAPFFVQHGIAAVQDEDQAIGRSIFILEIDGNAQRSSYIQHYVADGLLYRVWVFSYPEGMSGVHTFTGHWLAACGVATMYLPCGDGGRRDLVEFETQQITVTFTD